jgi:hypothetical protein
MFIFTLSDGKDSVLESGCYVKSEAASDIVSSTLALIEAVSLL